MIEVPTVPDSPLWLLLVHQMPAKPAYPRVKIWRRLQGLGAVAVKNSVYVLPASAQAREDFSWLLKEIIENGGDGMICEARLRDGLSDHDMRGLFNTARGADYDALEASVRELQEKMTQAGGLPAQSDTKSRLARLRADAARVLDIDFFGADGRARVNGLFAVIEAELQKGTSSNTPSAPTAEAIRTGRLHNRVWVTRRDVHADRIASAWLIGRFIDAEASFKFVGAKNYQPSAGELRFDMFEAEFTHEGERCTFEVLLARTGLADRALIAIAEIVHDIDLKDRKFGREEASGVAHLIEGIRAAQAGDTQRLARGAALFDDLYLYFRQRRR